MNDETTRLINEAPIQNDAPAQKAALTQSDAPAQKEPVAQNCTYTDLQPAGVNPQSTSADRKL